MGKSNDCPDDESTSRMMHQLIENDKMLVLHLERIYEELDEARSNYREVVDEFDRVYEALDKANRQLMLMRFAFYFIKRQIDRPNSRDSEAAWQVLNLLVGNPDEEVPPMPEGFMAEIAATNGHTAPSGEDYDADGLKVTSVSL